jgi:hypothetical protein
MQAEGATMFGDEAADLSWEYDLCTPCHASCAGREPGAEPEVEPELEPELDEPEPEAPEPEAPEPEAPAGPMAEFDEAAVLAWLGSVPGLTAPQRAAVNEMMADAEFEGAELVGLGLGRIVALYYSSSTSSTSYHICEHIRCRYF